MSASNTRFVALGELLELCDERNAKGLYGMDDVMGMTITKEVIPTKADVKDADLSKYLVVKPNEFVYNPRTHGKRIGLGYNKTDKPFLISWNNTAFKIKDLSILNPDYLYMYLNRIEWDRNACFRSWGSSTEVFSWAEFCLMTIPLPSIDTQRELVAVYKGLLSLAETNETLLQPLSEACKAFIVNCKKKYPHISLSKCIEECKEKNTENRYGVEHLQGVTSDSVFDYSKADTTGLDFSKYKVVHKNDFAYNPSRVNLGSIALQKSSECIISPMYVVFHVTNDKVLPEFLQMWFSRKEFQRSTLFYAMGSVRDTFDFNLMQEVQIPLPPIDVQESVIKLYRCYEEAREIASQAREQLKTLCPALVQMASHSA